MTRRQFVYAVQLEFVHGYRSHDSRHNLFYTPAGELVYPAAGVGVVMEPTSRKQRFFQGHDDDVVWCVCSADSGIVGEKLRCVWNSGIEGVAHISAKRSCSLSV